MNANPERGDKHGAHLDDEMAAEVRGHVQGAHSPRVEEWHEPEPETDDQPATGQVSEAAAVGGSPPGMDSSDVAGRSELARYLSPSEFPAEADDLAATAVHNGAPDAMVAQLRSLPAGRSYVNVTAVWAALGHGTEDDDERF